MISHTFQGTVRNPHPKACLINAFYEMYPEGHNMLHTQ